MLNDSILRLWRRVLLAAVLGGVMMMPITTAAVVLSEVVVDQGPHNPALESRNSNTVTNNASDQQVADDFTVAGAGLKVNKLELWFTYRDLVIDQVAGIAPALQNMLIQIFLDDGAGRPGAEVYQADVTFVPENTGEQNGFQTPNEIFYAEIDLAHPFQPAPGERYWLSPLGADDDVTWQWQLFDANGERRSRGGAGGPEWRSTALDNVTPLMGDFAFRLHAVPEPGSAFLFGLAGWLLLGQRRRG